MHEQTTQVQPLATEAGDATPIPRLLTVKAITAHFVSVSTRQIWRWVSEGKFPQPTIRDGTRLTFWSRDDVEAWYAGYVQQHRPAKGESDGRFQMA